MATGSITVVGLGPGAAGQISLETLQLLREGERVILRTAVHPSVKELVAQKFNLEACDRFYKQDADFEAVYGHIVDYVMSQAATKQVVYAVPGSPLVAEKTVLLLREAAKKQGIPLKIMPAMSFLDLAYVDLEIDPINGLRIIDAQDFEAIAEAGRYPLMITQVYSELVAADLKISLMDVLKDEAEIYFLRNLGLPDAECRKIKLYELDRQPGINHLTSAFVPMQPRLEGLEDIDEGQVHYASAQDYEDEDDDFDDDFDDEEYDDEYDEEDDLDQAEEENPTATDKPEAARGTEEKEPSKSPSAMELTPLTRVIKTLREPGGCPWDREQDHSSIRVNMIEEVYEFIEAVDKGDIKGMQEELGDILMQLAFHARLAEEQGLFDMQSIISTVTEKLIHRHPHVFGTLEVADSAEVLRNWEAIKREEKKERKLILDGVYKGLPSLLRAHKVQSKAAKVGFDWKDLAPVEAKVKEEWQELQEAVAAKDKTAMEEELGDVFFALVNYARHLGLDSEAALNRTNNKFTNRFNYVENSVKKSEKSWSEFSLEELDKFWDSAKSAEKH